MAKLTPKQIQEKHSRRLKGALEDVRIGVNGVTEAPTLRAAKKIDKMRQNLMSAIDSGKVERGLKRVSLEDWKKSMLDVGIGRISAGLDHNAAKVESFYQELMPHIDKLQAEVRSMPDTSLEDNIARMTSFVRGMAKFQRNK